MSEEMTDSERHLVWQLDGRFMHRRGYWLSRYAECVKVDELNADPTVAGFTEFAAVRSERRWHAVEMLAAAHAAEQDWRDYVARDDAERRRSSWERRS